MKKIVRQISLIPVAALIYAAGVTSFLDPNGIAPGGITGIAIVINRILSVDTGTLILLLNILANQILFSINLMLLYLYKVKCR